HGFNSSASGTNGGATTSLNSTDSGSRTVRHSARGKAASAVVVPTSASESSRFRRSITIALERCRLGELRFEICDGLGEPVAQRSRRRPVEYAFCLGDVGLPL